MAVPVLTAESIELLREIVQHYRSLVQRGVGSKGDKDTPQASDVYVARAPAGGIAALTVSGETGTGTGVVIPTPGYAECEIWRTSQLVEPPELAAIYGFTKTVFNVAQVAIDEDTWFPVVMDKHGIWYAVHSPGVSSGGCTSTITFVSGICRVFETGTA